MKKRILLIGYNFLPEPIGIGKYSGEMIMWLAKNGYDCEVITSYPYYPQWKVSVEYAKSKFWYSTEYHTIGEGSVKINRCPMYVPSIPTGSKRVLLDFTFLVTAFVKLVQLLFAKKFDYVITVVPCFQFGLLGLFYKKLRRSMFIYHIQDLQIEAARDLNMIKSQVTINAMFRIEKYILQHSDVISSISESMVRKIRIKAKKDVYLFSNWTDCKQFYPLENRADIKIEYGFNPSDIVILYSGAIGEKQGLDTILYAAKALEHHNSIKFIICGTGPFKKTLSNHAESMGLSNVFFLPIQPFEKLNTFLNMADVHLVIQKANASDLVMPSKLATILGIGGLALITAKKSSGLYSYINRYNIGMLVEPGDQEVLNHAIFKAVISNYDSIKRNARIYAEEHLSIDKIMLEFENLLLNNHGGQLNSLAENYHSVYSQLP
jgi:colanic acid biosynthesis glycosyl transferase WcaI